MVMSTLSVATRSSNLVQVNYHARPSQIKEQMDGRIRKQIEIVNEIQSFKWFSTCSYLSMSYTLQEIQTAVVSFKIFFVMK